MKPTSAQTAAAAMPGRGRERNMDVVLRLLGSRAGRVYSGSHAAVTATLGGGGLPGDAGVGFSVERPARGRLAPMPATDSAAQLARASLFSGLSEAQLARVAAISRPVRLAAGTSLFQDGDPADGLYCVVGGVVRIYLDNADGRELTITLCEEGEVIGEVALLDGLSRSANAAALTDVELLFVGRRVFLELIDEEPGLSKAIVLALCERLRLATDKINRAAFLDLRDRLLVLLRELAIVHGHIEPDAAVVDLELTQGMLAQMLGATREAVNKQLRMLQKDGRIRMEGGRIAVSRLRPPP